MRTLQFSRRLLGSSILAFCMFAAAQAQDPAPYVISAKAGGVNLVSGGVMRHHKTETEWQPLELKDRLVTGDVVRTDSHGRLEVLLNPGSYLRVDASSEFELADPSLDSLRIDFIKGSGILEVTGFQDAELLTEIHTPHARIAIVRNGLYRIDVQADTTELLVRKGRALVGIGKAIPVKGGKKVTASGPAGIEVAKFDKKVEDSFDQWSMQRAETLIAANRRLSDSHIAYSLVSAMDSGWGYDSWLHRGMGVWIYNPLLACHTFYPFYSGMSSPYGHHYRVGLGAWPGRYSPLEPVPNAPSHAPAAGNGTAGTGRPIPVPTNPPKDDVPLRPVPLNRNEQRQIQERIFPDISHGHAMNTFGRGREQSSQPIHSGSTHGPVSAASPAPLTRHPHEQSGANRNHGKASAQ